MSNIAIRVENLGKQYRIGTRQRGYKTLRESIADTLTSPFVRWRGRRRATIDGSSGHPSSVFAPSNSHSALRTPQSDYIWALKDVSFEIKQGEVVGIIGRNGAGKSTLLKTLSRITEPTEGVAEIRGRVGSLLEVGTGFHPELTGRENIYLNGAILGMHKAQIDRNLDSIVAFAEIEQFLDTPVKRYSSGMYVRLAFAVAAHLAPDVLLVDEVLAVGDAQFQKKCLGKMQDVSLHEGRTILFVSHNMGVVANLCGRVILLENGIVRRDGEPGAVIAEYISASHRPQDEVVWAAADAAAGNARMRLHRARILCRGRACSDVEIDQDVMIV
jgi:lipopolysaccharide transport system ATP-binding protein